MGAGSASLDCFVGQALRKKDPGLAFDSLHLSHNVDDLSAARRGSGMNCPSWFEKDLPNAPEPAAIAEAVGATVAGTGFGDPKFGVGAYAPVRG